MVLHTTIGKRRSGAFKQKKVYQNRTIIKEVISKNVNFLLALGSGPGSRPMGLDGSDPGAGQVRTRGLDRSGPPGVGQVRTPGSRPGSGPARARAINSICYSIPQLERGDQELSNKKKFIKIGPLLRKL